MNSVSIKYLTILIILANRLYWTDGKRNSIESSDLDGENRKIVAIDSDANLMDIISHGRYLYYTAGNRQYVLLYIFCL